MLQIILSSLALFGSMALGHDHDHGHSHSHGHDHSHTHLLEGLDSSILTNLIHYMKENVFIFHARYNAMISATIIQLLPFCIICIVPININLHVLISFALGTLLGEIFLHLIPESNSDSIGIGLFIGLLTFLTIDKTMRILTAGTSSSAHHGHSHTHSHPHSEKETEDDKSEQKTTSIYLNIVVSLLHNVTDGITIATSFYKSVPIGIITMVAFLFHELPHQLSDYVIISTNERMPSNSKFNFFKKSVAWSLTGSLIGTFISCAINEGLYINTATTFGTKFTINRIDDYLLPFSAGGLIYLTAVNIIPEVLETPATKSKFQSVLLWLQQLLAIFIGFYMMYIMAE